MRKMNRAAKRGVTLLVSALMVFEAVQCTVMTVQANDVVYQEDAIAGDVNAAEEITVDDDLAAIVDAAESADEAAFLASQAAEDAVAAAEALGTTAEEAVTEEIEEAIDTAETEVEEANEAIEELQQETEEVLDDIVGDAVQETQEKLEAAEAAEADALAAKEAAEEAAWKVANAADQFTAQRYAKVAQEEADKAATAADTAYGAYTEALAILEQAVLDYEDAVATAQIAGVAAITDATEALEAAQKAIDDATAAVNAAKEAYDAAMTNAKTAAEAADEAQAAADEAQTAADEAVENLEEVKGVDSEALAVQVEETTEAYAGAKSDYEKVYEEQYPIFVENANIVNSLAGQINNARVTATKTTKDVKSGMLWWKKYYTQAEIDAAKKIVADYDAAYARMAAAQSAMTEANNKATTLATQMAEQKAALATVTDYIYNNDAAVTYDTKDDAEYTQLLADLKTANEKYNNAVALHQSYADATDNDFSIWNIKSYLEKKFAEWGMEFDYNKISIDGWKITYTDDGLTLLIGKNEENLDTIIAWEADKLTIATVESAEFAAYSATFDAVAAAQAAAKAAEAKQAEVDALAKYTQAVKDLEAAQARLDALKLAQLELKEAEEALAAAQKNVDDAQAAYNNAKDYAEAVQELADNTKAETDTKTVVAGYYVLNRGLTQPSEVSSYPSKNYSKIVKGTLKWDGESNADEIAIYKKGVKGDAVAQYLDTVPDRDALATIGVELKDDEYVYWYVIKTEGDGYHVDGIIMNQKFTITVEVGTMNGDEFVPFTDENGNPIVVTRVAALDEKYEIVLPEFDEYVAQAEVNEEGKPVVTGIATEDKNYRVIYTAEDRADVVINYFVDSTTGTPIHATNMTVAVSKVAAFDEAIEASYLNSYKPGNCENGVLVSYEYDAENDVYVAVVLYRSIPTTVPTEDPEPVIIGEEPTPLEPIIEEEPEQTPAPEPIEEEEDEGDVAGVDREPVVETIDDDDTPLAPSIEEDGDVEGVDRVPTETIEEEDVPLAADLRTNGCWIHWLILLLTAIYTVYNVTRAIIRARKINEATASKVAENN